MSDARLFSLKMRASRGAEHVSGAERIVSAAAAPETAAALVRRALAHSKGEPDFVNVKVARTDVALRVKALPVATEPAATPREGFAIGDERKAVDVSARLLERGFLVPAIRYPTVARGKARLRIAVSAAHDDAVLAAAAEAVAACLRTP